MFGRKRQEQDSLIDKTKLIYGPLMIMLTAIIVLGSVALIFNEMTMLRQLEAHSLHVAHQTVGYVNKHFENKNAIMRNMEDKLTVAGKMILRNKNRINNAYLAQIADDFGITKIYYYTPEGKIIYSSTGEYIGWQAVPGDPIYNFMQLERSVFHEGIRKSTETDEYYKFSYFRDPDGGFVQVGYRVEEMVVHTDRYDLQTVVDRIARTEDIVFASVTDTNLVSIAHSNALGIGTDFSQNPRYQQALMGKASATNNGKALEVTVPLVIGGDVKGVLTIGHSMESLQDINRNLILDLFALSGMIAVLVYWSQRKYVIRPMVQLSQDIGGLDIEGNTRLYLPVSHNNPLKGIYTVINHILGRIEGYVSKINDLNAELGRMVEDMEYMAYHDALTGLPNRRFMMEKLNKVIGGGKSGALCLIDLKDMKEINDTFGHVYGDEVLKLVAKNLLRLKKDTIFPFRFGGDEFVVVILGDTNHVHEACAEVMSSIRISVEVDDQVFDVDCSMGVALFPQDGTNADDLIGKADLAMYQVKTNLRQGYCFFEPAMLDSIVEKNRIHSILKQAVKNDGFKLLYQPIVEAKTGEIVGFEALLRLTGHNISPAVFIGIAEEKGLINSIGRWVVREAVRQLSVWKREGIDVKPVAVNLSPRQIWDDGFIDYLAKTLAEYDVQPGYLEIEITENVFVEDNRKTMEFLQRLRNMGVRVSLDDFGSGYSSLNYLTYMPVDKIKLDKSINDKYLNESSYGIIKHIIGLSHDLRLKVVAEGIEHQEQVRILREIGCDYIQGYLFSRPVEAGDAQKMQFEGKNSFHRA